MSLVPFALMKSRVRDTYNKICATWNNKVWAQSEDFNSMIVEFADIQGDEKALDVGIGSGDLETFLPLTDVTGIDISEGMIRECRKKHPKLKLYACDAEHLPFKDNSFDFVYCRNLLQHFDDPVNAVMEMRRVARPKGKIMAIESAVYENERQFVTDIVRLT